MGFISKIFGKNKNELKEIYPNRALTLKSEPTAENGKLLSQDFIDAVKSSENIELDLTENSLKFVDDFLEHFSKNLKMNDFAETIFVAGCYCGQVMVESANGIWINAADANLPDGINMMPIVIKMPNGKICDPIGSAFKRFGNGESNSISYFYKVFTE